MKKECSFIIRYIIQQRWVFAEKKKSFELSVSKLDSLSPLKTLERGFSVAKDKEGKVLKTVSDAKSGDDISLVVTDGEIKATVK